MATGCFTNAVELEETAAGEMPVLMYHHLAARADVPRPYRYLYVSPEVFRRQMRGLLRLGFESGTLNFRRADKRVVITFDDGLESVFRHGLSALAENGFRAMQFLVSDRIGQANCWDLAAGLASAPLMDDAQVREWLAAGHEIGGHTRTHQHLTRLTREQAREEIAGCKRALEDRFGVPIQHFCYPYGDWNAETRELVQEAGYASACTVEARVATLGDDPFTRPRLLAKQPAPGPLRRAWQRVAGR